MSGPGARRLVAAPAVEIGAQLGEGPVWDPVTATLSFVDILLARLYQVVDGQARLVVELDRALAAALRTDTGGFLLVTREGFSILAENATAQPLLDVLGGRTDVRFNDAACDPRGRCFAGTLSLTGASADGQLMRLDAGASEAGGAAHGPSAATVVSGVGLANGLDWSPDGRDLYFTDTLSGRVDRFDYDLDRGELGARHPFVSEPPGTPDGLCVDDDGGVWIALWEGAQVHRYTPSGRLDTVVDLPVPHVTSCAFGGSAGTTLMLTTARAGMAADEVRRMPHAGDVFAVETGVSGRPGTAWDSTGFVDVERERHPRAGSTQSPGGS